MIRRAVLCCLAIPFLLAGCGRLSHLAPSGFAGAKPEPTAPAVEALILEEKEGVRRGFRPLADMPQAPSDLPTAEWAAAIRRDLEEAGRDPVSEDADPR